MEPFVIAKKTFANIRDISIRSGRFIRKYKNPLCLSILCVGTLWGIFQILLPGHVFNGDFALYIRQALSISAGDMKQVGEDMQAMINGSTYNRYSPTLYPWGGPLLLSLITSFSDIDYWLFKTEGIILFIGALFLLYRNLTHQKGGMNNKVFFILSLTGGNVFYWHFCNSVTSEIFFLFFLQLSFFCMYSLYNTQRKTFSTIHLFILGIILYFTAQIRTEGYFVFLSLAALQWKYRIKKKALWMPYVGAIVSGVFFSLIFPNGYLEHIGHFKMLSWEQVVDNLFHFYNYPIRIFHFPLPWFNTFFWVCWTIGLYIGIHKYTAETVYMLSCILLLMIWPYPEIRYWFALFPLCFLCFAEGIHLFFEQMKRTMIPFVEAAILLFLSIYIWGISVSCIYPDKPSYSLSDPNVDGREAQEMFSYLRENTKITDWIACGESRSIYLYTGRLCSNAYGDINQLDKRFDWYVVFRHRGNYLQYNPGIFRLHKKKFLQVFKNKDYIIYKIIKEQV